VGNIKRFYKCYGYLTCIFEESVKIFKQTTRKDGILILMERKLESKRNKNY